ncbi:MAG: hypothetical protein CVV18_00285 [Gammaproteobacteria bacterium HGW-Gammaproteobacteria-8]|nr:MAG: hypothetical protein CVV18_00285 [Gammaproteobacteria bacterium HGW-Gammaproteobacteria-8]
MAFKIGSVNGVSQLAHYNMLQAIHDFLTADAALVAAGQQWTVLRYDTVSANRELILQGSGLSGTEQLFIGVRTYQSEPGDFYNLAFATFTGFLAGNPFDSQPGARLSGVPAHNNAIDYWMVGNGQRLAVAMKVGTPVYMSGYVGKMFPYARPTQFPSPLINAGMLIGVQNTRFSDASIVMPYKGTRSNFALRNKANLWITPDVYPWNNTRVIAGNGTAATLLNLRDTGGYYHPMRVEPNDNSPNVYGFLDGIFYITGFNNAVENVMQVGGTVVDQTGLTVAQAVAAIIAAGGRAFVVIQDSARTGPSDYYAMEMA